MDQLGRAKENAKAYWPLCVTLSILMIVMTLRVCRIWLEM